ncbi:MAG TPA: DUF3488 and transglutaminase-like domain-containing protein, partial [Candidatus Polarisedimenticolia bacterium]|nr:DUF3488 and transglutaminase-like domain-containing protein [Candidatus Polarisedimenticolia bacterium]
MAARFALLTVRNGVACCLMIAATALLSVEAIGPLHALLLAAAVLYGRWNRKPVVPGAAWDALAVAALIFFPFDLFLLSRNLIGAALRLLTFVVIYRCSNLSEHRDLRQAVALSFVQILAAAASTTEMTFAGFLAAYLFMAVWTLMAMASARDGAPPPLRRPPPGRPAAALTGMSVAMGAVFFVTVPHLGTGYFQPAAARSGGETLTGFADRIELGSINRIKKNRAIVMRVRLHGGDPASMPVRWRGLALDTFDGRSWSVGRSDRRWVSRDPDGSFHVGEPLPRGRRGLDHEVSMLPVMVPVLFTAPGAYRIVLDGASRLGLDDGGAIHLESPPLSRFTYRAVAPPVEQALLGYAGSIPLGEEERRAHLALPRIDGRIESLARRVAGETADFERARRLEDHLRRAYAYSLDVNDAGVTDPLGRFLLEGSPGHCEYFATAMAVMLRYLEIPSRVVNGFLAGEWSPITESFVVRQSDAHSWVEAWIPGRGWVTFDPTPSRGDAVAQAGWLARWRARVDRVELLWDTWVVGLDLLDQQSLVTSLFDSLAWAALALSSAGAALAGAAARLARPGWS